MADFAIPFAALIISAAALIFVAVNSLASRRAAEETRRDSANKEYVRQLEKRVDACEEGRKEERAENIRLRSKLEAQDVLIVDLRLKTLELEHKAGMGGAT